MGEHPRGVPASSGNSRVVAAVVVGLAAPGSVVVGVVAEAAAAAAAAGPSAAEGKNIDRTRAVSKTIDGPIDDKT